MKYDFELLKADILKELDNIKEIVENSASQHADVAEIFLMNKTVKHAWAAKEVLK